MSMTLEQIKSAVDAGQTVHWASDRYSVIHGSKGQWLIKCDNGSCIGLTWRNGVTMNGEPREFYAA